MDKVDIEEKYITMAAFQFTHPESFDFARPETWEKWFQRFERFRSASSLESKAEEVQVNTLIYCMGGEAEDILDSLNLSDADRKKYKNVTEALQKYFVPKRNVIFERAKFNQRTQMKGESVDTYETNLYKLAENCIFGELRDQLIRDRLVVGLRDYKLSEKLQLDAELTLEKAITQARQHETVKKQQPMFRGKTTVHCEESIDAVKIRYQKQTNPRRLQPSEGGLSRKSVQMLQMRDKWTFCQVLPVKTNRERHGRLGERGRVRVSGGFPWIGGRKRRGALDNQHQTGEDGHYLQS